MILKREFYFIRHGQTDHNLREGKDKEDYLEHIPLNQTGRAQAAAIEPIIALLPVQTICVSPMKRAQETKDIISVRLQASHQEIDELGECSASIWKEMARLGMYASFPSAGEVHKFIQRVKNGLNRALSLPSPPLIVSHGGVHWATCCLMKITNHEWALENCGLVHFSLDEAGKWSAKKLS
jgi:uncharacterized phosphatase